MRCWLRLQFQELPRGRSFERYKCRRGLPCVQLVQALVGRALLSCLRPLWLCRCGPPEAALLARLVLAGAMRSQERSKCRWGLPCVQLVQALVGRGLPSCLRPL